MCRRSGDVSSRVLGDDSTRVTAVTGSLAPRCPVSCYEQCDARAVQAASLSSAMCGLRRRRTKPLLELSIMDRRRHSQMKIAIRAQRFCTGEMEAQ